MTTEEEKQLIEDVKTTKQVLIGNEVIKQKGLITIVHEQGERISVLEEFRKKLYWQATAIGGFAAVVIEVLMKIKNYYG